MPPLTDLIYRGSGAAAHDEQHVAEMDRIVRGYFDKRDGMEPVSRKDLLERAQLDVAQVGLELLGAEAPERGERLRPGVGWQRHLVGSR